MLLAPACFILPAYWSKYEGTIKRCLDKKDGRLHSSFDSLSRRNWRLRDRSLSMISQATKSYRQKVVVCLDSLFDDQNFGETARVCLRVISDYDLLIRTCIEWSSSIYRYGRFRTYAGARLLRIWKRKGIDIQGPIFKFLASSSDVPGLQKSDVYRLLAELVRSQHLSAGKYLQWLIARGTLNGHHEPQVVITIISMISCNQLTNTEWSTRCRLAIRASFARSTVSRCQSTTHASDSSGSPCSARK